MISCLKFFQVTVRSYNFIFFAEGIPLGNSDADRQLLEAAKAGDVDTVKVSLKLS